MKRFIFVSIILLCQSILVSAQQTKSSFHFKSIRIENGDTIVNEKNYESDDPNFNFSDSLTNGSFSFKSEIGKNPNEIFKDFGIVPFQGMPLMPQIENPLFNDSIMNQFFQNPIMDSLFFNKNMPNYQKYFPENSFPQLETYNDDFNLSDFKVAIVPNSNMMNVTFKLSQDKPTELLVINKKGKKVFSEKYDKSNAYFIKQFDISDFKKGDYNIVLKQGESEKSISVLID